MTYSSGGYLGEQAIPTWGGEVLEGEAIGYNIDTGEYNYPEPPSVQTIVATPSVVVDYGKQVVDVAKSDVPPFISRAEGKTENLREQFASWLRPYFKEVGDWLGIAKDAITYAGGGGTIDLRPPAEKEYSDSAWLPFMRVASLFPDAPVPDVAKQAAGFMVGNLYYGASGMHNADVTSKALTSGKPLPLSTFLPPPNLVGLVESPSLRKELAESQIKKEMSDAYSREEARWYADKSGVNMDNFLGPSSPESKAAEAGHYLQAPYAKLLDALDSATADNKAAKVVSDILSTAHLGAAGFSGVSNLRSALPVVSKALSNPTVRAALVSGLTGAISGGAIGGKIGDAIMAGLAAIPGPTPPVPGGKGVVDYSAIFPSYDWSPSAPRPVVSPDPKDTTPGAGPTPDVDKSKETPKAPPLPGSNFASSVAPYANLAVPVVRITNEATASKVPAAGGFGGAAGSVRPLGKGTRNKVALLKPGKRNVVVSKRKRKNERKNVSLPGGATQVTGEQVTGE